MSADSPRRSSGSRGFAVPAIVPPQVVSDRSILDSAIGFINDVTLAHQPHTDPKDTITWARFESAADISDPRFGEDWELEGNVAPPLLLILGYGLGVQVWAIPANGEAVEVLSWRHGSVSALRVLPTPLCTSATDVNGRADEPVDSYIDKRPLIALVDGSTASGPQPQFCAVNFVSLKTGAQVKTIKFKNPVLDVLANRSAVVITFHERIAVFDARTLDDRLSITTCYPSPGINPNPVALGSRWLAYAEQKLLHSKRSGAGCDGDGVASYTATVLNAAKSFGKGLRELGEQVAAGLTGTTGSVGNSKNNSFDSNSGFDAKQPGIVTIMDIKHVIKDYSPTTSTPLASHSDPIVAHFIAHSEAIVALEFDNSGMLLVTADRRGHDFHIFRIQPHPVGSSLAAVHHLYVLHRGDTSAKVQNIAFSLDTRWVAVSTLRGTTHVFPITPYGGPMGVRTHTSLHVVNKLSRFHRSAGLSADGRSNSPISHSESTTFVQSLQPYHNTTLPPYPRPSIVLPLAQLRQPFALGSPPGSAAMAAGSGKTGGGGLGGGVGGTSQRQRLSSLSDDNGKPLSVCAIFAKSRSWLLDPPNATREAPHRIQRKAVDSLFVMAGHGALIQYDLDTKLASNVAKEKICDDTPIELEVEAKAQWNLGRRKDGSQEIMPPLAQDNWLIKDRNSCMLTDSTRHFDDADDRAESWLSQVEIITHAGPHRRLWMGPQFVFKTYNTPSGSNLSHVDAEAVEIGVSKSTTAAAAAATRVERSSPLNMPLSATERSSVPVFIESGSYSSIEQSPKLMDRFHHERLNSDLAVAHGDTRLKEDLADAMRESPSVSAAHKETGRLPTDATSSDNVPFYDALANHDDDESSQAFDNHRSSSAAALASALPNIYSYDTSSSYESLDSLKNKKSKVSIEKIVNPLGTVTNVTVGMTAEVQADMLDEVVSQLAAEDCVIHENCDESLFRPVIAIFCDENARKRGEEEARKQQFCKPPEVIGNKLIVPVIAKDVDAELSKKEKQKMSCKLQRKQQESDKELESRFSELSSLNTKCKAKPSSKESIEESREAVKIQVKNIALQQSEDKVLESENVVKEVVKEKPKPGKKTSKVAVLEVEDEKPLEFKRMTPKVEDKSTISKRANEKQRKSEERDTKSMKAKSAATVEKKSVAAKVEDKLQAAVNKEELKESFKNVRKSEERELQPIADNVKSVELKSMTSELPKQTAENVKTAAAENSKSSKATTTIKTADTKNATKSDDIKDMKSSTKLITSNEELIMETIVKTEILNVSELADSLMDIKPDDDILPISKAKKSVLSIDITEKEDVPKKPDTCVAPKLSKKSKRKQSSSSSNSEAEEMVEVITTKVTQKSSDTDEIDAPSNVKKSSLSSNDSYTDLADSLLESKSAIEETMHISFSQKENTSTKNNTKSELQNQQDTKKETVTSKSKITTKKINNEEPKIDVESNENTSEQASEEDKKCNKLEGKINNEKASNSQTSDGTKLCAQEESASQQKLAPKTIDVKLQETAINSKTAEKKDKDFKEIDDEEKEEEDNKMKPITVKVDTQKIEVEKSKEKVLISKKISASKDIESSKTKETVKQSTNKLESTNTKDDTKNSKAKQKEFASSSEIEVTDKRIVQQKDTKDDSAIRISKILNQKKISLEETIFKADKLDEVTSIIMPTSVTKIPTKAETPKQISANIVKAEAKPVEESAIIKKSKTEIKSAESNVVIAQPKKENRNVMKSFAHSELDAESSTLSIGAKSKKEKSKPHDSEVQDNDDLKSVLVVVAQPKEARVATPISPAWKTLSGAELISQNMTGSATISASVDNYPSLDKTIKNKKGNKYAVSEESPAQTAATPETLLPELKSPQDFKEPLSLAKTNKKAKKTPPTNFDDFPLLKPLEALSPLPTLEPLQLVTAIVSKSKNESDASSALKDSVSLINFESPLQENPALVRKITPPPRGFTEQNLIFALCGSLHYENETPPKLTSTEKLDISSRSSSALDENSITDYKSLTETSDEPYISLDQSSQETNTTNTATTNEKLSSYSSNSSSASEEIIVLEEKKMTKKQKRKRQQIELQKQNEQALGVEADEELRPLISMSDSQLETYVDTMIASEHFGSPLGSKPSSSFLMDASFSLKLPTSNKAPLSHSTTTDSEGPMPATTSEDNVFSRPPTTLSTSTPHKLKTKKLEHKINLIAAIEAATSSSTSSAEESGVEAGGRSSDMDAAATALVSVATTPTLPLPVGGSIAVQQSAAKKKTKRRKR